MDSGHLTIRVKARRHSANRALVLDQRDTERVSYQFDLN